MQNAVVETLFFLPFYSLNADFLSVPFKGMGDKSNVLS